MSSQRWPMSATMAHTERFLQGFDSLVYEGVRVARILNSPVYTHLLLGAAVGGRGRRRLLESLPGRAWLWARSHWRRGALRGRPPVGTVFRISEGRNVLDEALAQVTAPYQQLALEYQPSPGEVRLSELVPGKRHGWSRRPVRDLYRRVWRGDAALQARLPEDSEWFERLVRVALDTVDAAGVFWGASDSPGAVSMHCNGFQELALALIGRRLGRRVVTIQHGYHYGTWLFAPEAYEAFFTWDAANSHQVRRASGGELSAPALGPYGVPALPEAPRAVPGLDPGRPRVLLASNPVSEAWWQEYLPLYRALAAPEVPWTLLWKPHPAERRRLESLGERCVAVPDRSVYELLPQVDAVLGTHSGVLAQAHLFGLRVGLLTHPSEDVFMDWARRHAVPRLHGCPDLAGAVEALLGASPPPARWGRREGPRASARLAAQLDRVFRGRAPAGLGQPEDPGASPLR